MNFEDVAATGDILSTRLTRKRVRLKGYEASVDVENKLKYSLAWRGVSAITDEPVLTLDLPERSIFRSFTKG